MPNRLWTIVFVAACGIIPVLTFGGPIPAVIGVGGAVGCYSIMKGTPWRTSTKVIACIGVTIITWAIFTEYRAIASLARFPSPLR